MRKIIAYIMMISLTGTWFAACSEDENEITGPEYDEFSLVSSRVTTPPIMDGIADALWADARELVIADVNVPSYYAFWDGYHGDTYG
ncbi:MAG: hypothetical protein IH880_07280, partial [Candidatus Marinimicrobia bacterium]|nr:hypothetical protein [Candidatus Neomarinimicrobiota bacterium]